MPVPVPVPLPDLGRLALGLLVASAAACTADAPPIVPWLYDAPLPLAPRPPTTGGFGRGVLPISLPGAGITAGAGVTGGPLSIETLLAGPPDGPRAEAVGFGATADGSALALELIDVDAGVVRWRDVSIGLPPYAFTPSMVIVGDAAHVAGHDRATGGLRWQREATFRARDGELIAAGHDGGILLLDALTGEAAPRLAPPPATGEPAATDTAVIAVCATEPPHLYAWHRGNLMRWEPGAGGALRVAWTAAVAQPSRLDACGATVLVAGGGVVVALDPATGAIVGGPVAAHDYWFARTGDGVELATDDGLEGRDRRLGAPVPIDDTVVDRLVARRGARRLAVARDGALVLLDDQGARALAEGFGAMQAALGDRALLGGPWALPSRTQAGALARWLLPGPGPATPPNPMLPRALLGDPPRLDLPAARPLPTEAIAREGAGAWAIGAAFVDPGDAERVYVGVLEAQPTETAGGGVAAFDLHADAWRWYAREACPTGTPVALAAAADVVVCGVRGVVAGRGAVRAVRQQDGNPAWDWRGATVDAVLAAGGDPGPGDVVVVVAGARVIVLDGATGAERASWRTSDGYWPRIALARRAGDTLIASHEHGRVVLRSARLGLRPLAALEVRGTLAALFTVGDRIAAELKDGSVYFLDDAGAAVAAGALALGWLPAGDLAVATGVDGDAGLVVAVAVDGVPRVVAGLPGTGPVVVTGRGPAPGAPLVVSSGPIGTHLVVLAADGAPLDVLDLPDDAARSPVVSTVVHGRPVVGVVLAHPLRFVRVDVGAAATPAD